MTIKEVEERLNVSRANIRFYEKEGLLEPKRNDNEYRNYSEEDLQRLEKILLFRKCNVSIENIRLIFNGVKSIEEVFKEQISVIENEVQQLEGAKMLCEKLAQEKSSVDNIDAEKYINMIENAEEKGNKFYDIAEDYIFANEKLYQSIIENKNFKGGDKMKKGIKVLIYVASSILLFLLLMLFDYLLFKKIDWVADLIITAIFTVGNILGTKKFIENKDADKYTNKQKLNHILITVAIMIVALFGYYSIKEINVVNQEPNKNVLEISVKKSLIDIANEEYEKVDNGEYAECHKILDCEVKNNKIYVYVVAQYGIFVKNENEISSVDSKKVTLTIVYENNKNTEGTYEQVELDESIPDSLKNKSAVDFNDDYYNNQLNNYLNN